MPCRRWLLGLLVLQSTSSLVLDQYQQLLRDHLVVTLFLTMLVGAGGNAGALAIAPSLHVQACLQSSANQGLDLRPHLVRLPKMYSSSSR